LRFLIQESRNAGGNASLRLVDHLWMRQCFSGQIRDPGEQCRNVNPGCLAGLGGAGAGLVCFAGHFVLSFALSGEIAHKRA
jgi:hypothetical protein